MAGMGNERLPERAIFGELEGGKGYLGGQERGWMGCLDMPLYNLPTEETRWTLAVKKSGMWFGCAGEAAEQCMKRWFVEEKEDVAKRRALGVQNAQQLKTPWARPRPGGGGGRGTGSTEG